MERISYEAGRASRDTEVQSLRDEIDELKESLTWALECVSVINFNDDEARHRMNTARLQLIAKLW